jgi:hypothetical protein
VAFLSRAVYDARLSKMCQLMDEHQLDCDWIPDS